jgi:tetratricopeptide (TPR) repeat protein
VATSDDVSNKNLNKLDPMFMYTQIMKEILLSIKFDQQHINEFLDYCHVVFDNNEKNLQTVDKIKQEYHDETPIWWYTCEGFLYSMLNRALRMMDVDIMIKMGFFIDDLHRQIETLHNEQFGNDQIFTVYRGQGLSKANFEEMIKTKGGLMSFNSFLSTSKDRNVSLAFAESNGNNPDLIGILFVMTIDSSKSTTPFASIDDVSYFQWEAEVLFSMHTVFRIDDIKPMNENNRLFQVDLTLTSENDKDLRILTDRIREEIDPESKEWYRLGKLLLKLGQFDKAQQVYEGLLNEGTNAIEKATIYYHIGWAKDDKGETNEAIKLYKEALKIQQQLLPSNHPDLANSYHRIAMAYNNMGIYPKALWYYEKALDIRQKTLPPNHPDLAKSYNNIGGMYYNMGENSKALSYHEKAFAIEQQSLPPNHPGWAMSYNNTGNIYYNMGEYSKAISCYEKVLDIDKKSLPPNHPDLAASYNNIGNVYSKMGEYLKAFSDYQKALEIRQQSLPPNHPDVAKSYSNIGLVYEDMGEYSKALSFHEKALEIFQKSLSPNHPDLAKSYNIIGSVYESMDDFSRARSFYYRAVDIGQQSLPPNHPSLEKYRKKLDVVEKKL